MWRELTMARVPAVARTMAVMRHLAQQARPVAAAAIARDLDLPRSTVYHLLTTLAEGRFVTHYPEERVWGLGVGAFELGQAYLRHTTLERLARPLLHRLAHDVDASAHLAILDARDVVYLLTERPPQTVPLIVDVGVRLPAHLTASGRALLAAASKAQVHATFPDRASLSSRTGIGPTTPTALRQVLTGVRLDGVGREEGEIDPRLASVAVAAHDHTGRAVAAVTLTFPSADHDAAAREVLTDQVRAAASALTGRLRGSRARDHSGLHRG